MLVIEVILERFTANRISPDIYPSQKHIWLRTLVTSSTSPKLRLSVYAITILYSLSTSLAAENADDQLRALIGTLGITRDLLLPSNSAETSCSLVVHRPSLFWRTTFGAGSTTISPCPARRRFIMSAQTARDPLFTTNRIVISCTWLEGPVVRNRKRATTIVRNEEILVVGYVHAAYGLLNGRDSRLQGSQVSRLNGLCFRQD